MAFTVNSGIEETCQEDADFTDVCENTSIADSDDSESEDESIVDVLRMWALTCSVNATDVTELLKALAKFHPELPLCASTVLKTPPSHTVIKE